MNDDILNIFKIIFAAVGGAVGSLLGPATGPIYALLAFVVTDYLTGVIGATIEKRLNSEVGFKGIAKKVLIFVLVMMGHLLDKYIIGTGETIRTAVTFFYIANEGLSILENIGKLGLPLPDKLKNILVQLRDKETK